MQQNSKPLERGAAYAARLIVSPSRLTRLLEAEVARLPAEVGVYVKNPATGEEAGVRAEEAFNSASVIKIPVMMRAFQLADRGMLDLDARHEITRGDLVPGSGVLQYHDLRARPTLRNLITQMIISSDNTARGRRVWLPRSQGSPT